MDFALLSLILVNIFGLLNIIFGISFFILIPHNDLYVKLKNFYG